MSPAKSKAGARGSSGRSRQSDEGRSNHSDDGEGRSDGGRSDGGRSDGSGRAYGSTAPRSWDRNRSAAARSDRSECDGGGDDDDDDQSQGSDRSPGSRGYPMRPSSRMAASRPDSRHPQPGRGGDPSAGSEQLHRGQLREEAAHGVRPGSSKANGHGDEEVRATNEVIRAPSPVTVT
jgi:hypothetical protein